MIYKKDVEYEYSTPFLLFQTTCYLFNAVSIKNETANLHPLKNAFFTNNYSPYVNYRQPFLVYLCYTF